MSSSLPLDEQTQLACRLDRPSMMPAPSKFVSATIRTAHAAQRTAPGDPEPGFLGYRRNFGAELRLQELDRKMLPDSGAPVLMIFRDIGVQLKVCKCQFGIVALHNGNICFNMIRPWFSSARGHSAFMPKVLLR